MVDQDFDKLVKLIRSIIRSSEEIADKTRLYHDLYISGDDAVELIEGINATFGTKFEGFEFAKYFPDETEGLVLKIVEFFGYKVRQSELSVHHMREVISKGQWFDPR